MKRYSISKNVVLRQYGKIYLGYFTSDPKMLYFTIEGVAFQIMEILLKEEKTGTSFERIMAEIDVEENIIQKELNNLIKLSIVEVN